jgi:hypothetical protein
MMDSGLYSGISQFHVSTSESLRVVGMLTGVGVAVPLGAGVFGSVEKKFTASAADRNTTPAVSRNLALIIYPY